MPTQLYCHQWARVTQDENLLRSCSTDIRMQSSRFWEQELQQFEKSIAPEWFVGKIDHHPGIDSPSRLTGYYGIKYDLSDKPK
jgi:hypothetical protein